MTGDVGSGQTEGPGGLRQIGHGHRGPDRDCHSGGAGAAGLAAVERHKFDVSIGATDPFEDFS